MMSRLRGSGLVLALGLASVFLIMAACGGGTPEPTEEFLSKRAEARVEDLNKDKWEDLYEYVSPRWKTSCNAAQHKTFEQGSEAVVRNLLFRQGHESFEVRVSEVGVVGVGGRVQLEYVSDGETILGPGEIDSERWVFLEDQWWREPEDWPQGCAISDFTGQATPAPLPTPVPSPTASPTPAPTPLSLETYASFAQGVALSIPKGWTADDTDPGRVTIENPTGLARIEISLNTFTAPLTRAQFDEYVSLQLLQLREEFQSFQEIGRELVDDPPGLLISFFFDEEGEGQAAMVFYTFNNIRGARVLAVTTAAFFDFFSPLLEESITSIRLQPNPPGPIPTPAPVPTPAPTPVATFTPGIYSDTEPDFSLQVPSGWGLLEPGKEAAVRFLGPGEFIVQVLTAQIPATMSADLYALVLRESRYEPLSGYQLVSDGGATVGLLPAREVQFDAATGLDGSINRHLVLVMRVGTQAYIIEAIGPRDDFAARESQIRGFITSFRP